MSESLFSKTQERVDSVDSIKKPIQKRVYSPKKRKRFYWSLRLNLKSFYDIDYHHFHKHQELKADLSFQILTKLDLYAYFGEFLRGHIRFNLKNNENLRDLSFALFPIDIQYKSSRWLIKIGYIGASFLNIYEEVDDFIFYKNKIDEYNLYPYRFLGFNFKWIILEKRLSTALDIGSGTNDLKFKSLKDFSKSLIASWKIDYQKDFRYLFFQSELRMKFWQKADLEKEHRFLGIDILTGFQRGIFEQRILFSWFIEDEFFHQGSLKYFYIQASLESLFQKGFFGYKSIFRYNEIFNRLERFILWRNQFNFSISEKLTLSLEGSFKSIFKEEIKSRIILISGLELKI